MILCARNLKSRFPALFFTLKCKFFYGKFAFSIHPVPVADPVNQGQGGKGNQSIKYREKGYLAEDAASDFIDQGQADTDVGICQLIRRQGKEGVKGGGQADEGQGAEEQQGDAGGQDVRAGPGGGQHCQGSGEKGAHISAEQDEQPDLSVCNVVNVVGIFYLDGGRHAAFAHGRKGEKGKEQGAYPVDGSGHEKTCLNFAYHRFSAAVSGGKEDGIGFEPEFVSKDAGGEKADNRDSDQDIDAQVHEQGLPGIGRFVVKGRMDSGVFFFEKGLFLRVLRLDPQYFFDVLLTGLVEVSGFVRCKPGGSLWVIVAVSAEDLVNHKFNIRIRS